MAALTNGELQRIRVELGFNALSVGAEPFISTTALFETVIRTYLTAGAATTSATSVVAAVEPTPVTIVLTDATGFVTGDRIWLDVDERQESATIQILSTVNATVALQKAHSGVYKVSVDGGEAIVREYLNRIKDVKLEMASSFGEGALKKVDEIEWYQPGNKTTFGLLGDQLMFWRDELASSIGAPNLWRQKRGGGSNVAMY